MNPEQLTWLEPLEPASDSEIAAIEHDLGVSFPDDYRAFLRSFQGGVPAQTDFDLNDPRKSPVAVGVFMSTQPEREADYILTARSLLADRLPATVVPIAIGPSGDYICLDFRGTKPVVTYWHHERCGDPDEFTFIADSFDEFLSLLYEPDDEEDSTLD